MKLESNIKKHEFEHFIESVYLVYMFQSLVLRDLIVNQLG
jgi:hypothetical protein